MRFSERGYVLLLIGGFLFAMVVVILRLIPSPVHQRTPNEGATLGSKVDQLIADGAKLTKDAQTVGAKPASNGSLLPPPPALPWLNTGNGQ